MDAQRDQAGLGSEVPAESGARPPGVLERTPGATHPTRKCAFLTSCMHRTRPYLFPTFLFTIAAHCQGAVVVPTGGTGVQWDAPDPRTLPQHPSEGGMPRGTRPEPSTCDVWPFERRMPSFAPLTETIDYLQPFVNFVFNASLAEGAALKCIKIAEARMGIKNAPHSRGVEYIDAVVGTQRLCSPQPAA